MVFASCQCNPSAKSFIEKMYPSQKIEDEKIPKLIKLINEDVLRVQDPAFHQPCQIIAGSKYTNDKKAEVEESLEEFKREIHDK